MAQAKKHGLLVCLQKTHLICTDTGLDVWLNLLQHLPSKPKTLNSNPSTTKKVNKIKFKDRKQKIFLKYALQNSNKNNVDVCWYQTK
jgi:hypothetical protein